MTRKQVKVPINRPFVWSDKVGDKLHSLSVFWSDIVFLSLEAPESPKKGCLKQDTVQKACKKITLNNPKQPQNFPNLDFGV